MALSPQTQKTNHASAVKPASASLRIEAMMESAW
jgi:hypothetical protein